MENFELSSKGFNLFLPKNFSRLNRQGGEFKCDFVIYKRGAIFVYPNIYNALGINLNIWISPNAKELCLTSGDTFTLRKSSKDILKRFNSILLAKYLKNTLKNEDFPLHYSGKLKDGVYYLKFISAKSKK